MNCKINLVTGLGTERGKTFLNPGNSTGSPLAPSCGESGLDPASLLFVLFCFVFGGNGF
jgi:hypothetical protein